VLREPSLGRNAHRGDWREPAPTKALKTHATDHANRMAQQTDKHMRKLGRVLTVGTPRRMSKGGRRYAA
jgi:hypothetical protein